MSLSVAYLLGFFVIYFILKMGEWVKFFYVKKFLFS